MKITSPQDGDSVESEVEVTGVVTPQDATVDVNGEIAEVQGGRFTALVTLEKGQDELQATAAADAGTDQSVVAVDQQPTAGEQRARARRKAAARAERRQDAEDEASALAADSSGFTMPNEVGKSLQGAQDDLQEITGDPLFISESEDATGAGRFQVLDRGWQVCGQNVAPGETFTADTRIVFAVVKSYEDCP